tara:strand:- start:9597 stop:9827 length:231 start_codon:yes stop_codon:yes gene_type:complete
MKETEMIAKDQAIMGKTIGIIRGLQGKVALSMAFHSGKVIFRPSEGEEFTMDTALFNKLDTNEIVRLIEGQINGSK